MEETKEVDEKDVELEDVPLNEAQEVKLWSRLLLIVLD